ncbi:MAG TPA: TIR domain-containing protein, partial [Anaerolineales bacterium]|nr:TIR domain-containing protein [Anaerolineales bacterium]
NPDFLNDIGLPKPLQDTYLQEISMFLSTLQKLDIIPRRIRHKLRSSIGDGGFKRGDKLDSPIHRSAPTKEIFSQAVLAVTEKGQDFVTLNDLLGSLLESENKNIGQVLAELGINTPLLVDALRESNLSVNETLSPEEARRLIGEGNENDEPEITISVQSADGKTNSISLKQREIIIGRRGGHQPVDIDLHPDRSVSRQHARLYYQRHCWYVVDLGSTYGTAVDGIKSSKERLVSPSSSIQVGNSHISISYESFVTQVEEQSPENTGTITNVEPVDELAPPSLISEDERIGVLAEIMEIAASAQTDGELFEGCIQKIMAAIPNAERVTILIGEDNELLPIRYYPRQQPYYSNTFVNKARADKTALSWVLQDSDNDKKPASVFNAVAAMYAPMLRNKQIVGVLHADSKSLIEGFSKMELDTLSVIATAIALALKPSKNEERIPSVFISYAHKDTRKVNKLKDDLRRNGISVWMDERLKVADEAWQKQLALAIQKQAFFLFVMTPNSISSKFCEWELHTALSLQKPIVPVMLKKAAVPLVITTQQYIEFGKDYRKALGVLVQRLQQG